MRLLITTQVVDKNDPVLGFFHRWIEEFAKHTEQVTVVCLREGEHALPNNVRVFSLGKEIILTLGNTTIHRSVLRRLKYTVRFWRIIWRERNAYDTVFVHMNQEYVLLGGLLWRALGKKILFWYAHGAVTLPVRIAVLLCNRALTSTPQGLRIATDKKSVVGQGIDVEFFSSQPDVARTGALLSVGRLSPVKRHDLAIRVAAQTQRDLYIVGDGPERKKLEDLAASLGISQHVHFVGGATQEGLRNYYRTTGVFLHTSETGSLDKVVLEALACGLPVVSTSKTLGTMPILVVEPTPEAIAGALSQVHAPQPEYVRTNHSIESLVQKILTGASSLQKG